MRGEVSLSTFLLVFIFLWGVSEQYSFEDERCVCACPRSLCPNGTGPIFVKMIPASSCLCKLVVPQVSSSKAQYLCDFCTCKHETRNTTTIKVVVIFIICVVALLLIYMMFLMCLDPLLHGRRSSPSAYAPQIDDDVTVDNVAPAPRPRPSGETRHGRAATGVFPRRQTSLLNLVTNEQQKWKGTVEEQRRNIYKNHSMLN